MPCPDRERLLALQRGDLSPREIDALALHVEDCANCQALLEAAAAEHGLPRAAPAFSAELRAALRDGPQVESWSPELAPVKGNDDTATQRLGATPPADGAGPPRVAPGMQIGNYLLLDKLGQGGMGVVYRARQLGLDRLVALKMLPHEAVATETVRQRFLEEARSAAQLKHPNFVQVYDFGVVGEQAYIAMELVEGGTLRDRLGRPLVDHEESARQIATLARAMQTAHDAGIVHRDLKPSNVLVTTAGDLKISDFGLARRSDRQRELTATGTALGTPAYMAPEQAAAEGAKVGPAADVYALGAMLYEMLCGRPPFLGDNPWQVMQQLATDDPLPPSQRLGAANTVPPDLETICLKCLAKDPSDRYPSSAALADDLLRFVAGDPVQARPLSAPQLAWRWVARRPWQVTAAGLISVLVLLAAAWGLYQFAYVWEKVEYFEGMVDRGGEPVGVLQVPLASISKRLSTLRFTYEGHYGRVIRVEAIDRDHMPVSDYSIQHWLSDIRAAAEAEDPDVTELNAQRMRKACRYDIAYQGGRPHTITAYNATGEPVFRATTETTDGIHFTTRVTDPSGAAYKHGGAQLVRSTCDADGYTQRLAFYDVFGAPVTVDFGLAKSVEAVAFEYREGRIVALQFLDQDGKPATASKGCSRVEFSPDEHQRDAVLRYFVWDAERRENLLVKTTRFRYDAFGNPIETSQYDGSARLSEEVSSSPAIARMTIAEGRETRIDRIAADGRTLREVVTFSWNLTPDAYLIETQSFFDASGNCTEMWRYHKNQLRNITQVEFLDCAGMPLRNAEGATGHLYSTSPEGFARTDKVGFDEQEAGFEIVRKEVGPRMERKTYLTSRKELALSRNPAQSVKHFDADGKIVRREDIGFDTSRFSYYAVEYDVDPSTGNLVGVRARDEQGSPVELTLKVIGFPEQSAARDAGVHVGDLLISYDGETVGTAEFFFGRPARLKARIEARAPAGESVTAPLVVRRGGQLLTFEVPPGPLGVELEDPYPQPTQAPDRRS